MKRKLVTVLGLLFSLIGAFAIVTACKGTDEENPDGNGALNHAVVDEYYYDGDGTEYLISLRTENYFTYVIAGDRAEGKYTLEKGALTLIPDGGEAVSGTISGNILHLTYRETAYNFLLKVDYTVHFETMGGSPVADAKVLNGKKVARPVDPSQAGKVFVGWYTDESFHNAYHFTEPVTGELTLYARFVAPIDPEFTVSFDAGAGAETFGPRTTTGGMLFDLPVPVKEGAKFVGWYVSQSYSADELSYAYDEQPIEENITLYAVWDDGSPVVSVSGSGVDIQTSPGDRYSITITGPDGNAEVNNGTGTSRHYDFDFTSKAAGRYKVEVTLNQKTTTRYYCNKTLARVSVFKVEGSTLFFNAVGNATSYYLTAVCGTPGHAQKETRMSIDPGVRSWFFGECEMPEDGFKFTVEAEADGYISSTSETYTFDRTLGAVEGLTVIAESETVTWNAVGNASSYSVTIEKDGEEVYSANVGSATSFDLRYYDAANYTVKVQPNARGWKSPEPTVYTYQKTRLATPKAPVYDGGALSWEAVNGATGYVVTIDGKTYTSKTNTLSLTEVSLDASVTDHKITVRAEAENFAASLESDVLTLSSALGGLTYSKGVLSWNSVLGVTEYLVTVDGGDPQRVGEARYDVTFSHAGENKLSVSAASGDFAPMEITVFVYTLTYNMDKAEAAPHAVYYLAAGDPIPRPEAPTYYGYTFDNWYTAPGSGGEEFSDIYFGGQDLTVYAGWTANVHTITFVVGAYSDQNIESVQVRFGEKVDINGKALPVPESNNANRVFSGWHFESDAGIQIADFEGKFIGAFLQDNDVTLYASYAEVFAFAKDPASKDGYTVSKGPGIIQGIVTHARVPERYGTAPVTGLSDFKNCTKLETLDIPDTIMTIVSGTENSAFTGCSSLYAVNVYAVRPDLAVFSSDEGVLIRKVEATSKTELFFFPAAKSGEYTIPDEVTAIPSGAFTRTNALNKLNIGKNVTEIQTQAFNTCDGLTEIVFLPGGHADLDIREGAFSNCKKVAVITLPARIKEIAADTFADLAGLLEFKIEDGGAYSVIDGLICKEYNDGQVIGKEIVAVPIGRDFGNYELPHGVVSVGESAFYGSSKLTGLTVPGAVVNISSKAFGHVSKLESIDFRGTESDFDLTIADKAFYAGYVSSSNADTGVQDKLKELHLPANLTYLGQYSFGRYSGLTEVWITTKRPQGTAIDFREGAFSSESGDKFYVTTAHIGADCPAFSYSGVFGNKLANVDIDVNNPYVQSDDDVIYDKVGDKEEKQHILFYPMEKEGDFTVPETVIEIGASTFAARNGLTGITIPVSVASIGDSAFYNCKELQTVTFTGADKDEGEPLTIGAFAFKNCTKLSSVTLPARLTTIGREAFRNCDGLTEIELPKNLQTIEKGSVGTGTAQVEIFDVFLNCNNLKSLTVHPDNQYFTSIDSVLYQLKEMKKSEGGELERVPYEALFTSPGAEGKITVPGTVHIFGRGAFKDINKVTEIVFEDIVPLYDATGEPDNTYDFRPRALDGYRTDANEGNGYYNTSVKTIRLPDGLETIGDEFLCDWRGLTSVTIPKTVTSIHAKAFSGCWNITSFEFEQGGVKPLSFENGVVESNGGGGYVANQYYYVFGHYYQTDNAASNKDDTMKIDSIVLPSRTVLIGDYTFYRSPVKSITFDGDPAYLNGADGGAEGAKGGLRIGKYAFSYCQNLVDFNLPENTAEIGGSAFAYAVLNRLELPESLVTIGDDAFRYLHLTEAQDTLVIPGNVETIGQCAFRDEYGYRCFRTVDLSQASKLTSVGDYAFGTMKELETVTFAAAAEESPALTLGTGAFWENPRLKSVEFPANISVIGDYAFKSDTALESITFAAYGRDLKDEGKTKLKQIGREAFSGTAIGEFAFPESTEAEIKLGQSLFKFCRELTVVTLSTSVHSIDSVFTGCGSLKRIEVAEGSKYFSSSTQEDFPALFDANGESVLFVYSAVEGEFEIVSGTRIGSHAFENQVGLTKVTIAASVQEIGANAFAGCTNLVAVEFKSGSVLTDLGDNAFSDCHSLTNINLNTCSRLTTVGSSAFLYCYSLERMVLPSAVTSIGKQAFEDTGVTEIDLSACATLETIGDSAMQNTVNLKTVKLPAALTTLGAKMFTGSGLVTVDFSKTALTVLGSSTFSDCVLLESVKLPDSLVFLGTNTFSGCTALKEIDLSNTSVEHLSDKKGQVQVSTTSLNLFNKCAALTKVTFPAGLKSIGYNAFSGAPALEEICIGDGEANDFSAIETMVYSAFAGSSLTHVKLSGKTAFKEKKGSGSGSSEKHYGTFTECNALEKVEWTEAASLTKIGEDMFFRCTSLTEFDFTQLKGLTKIGKNAFRGCESLAAADLSVCAGGADLLKEDEIFEDCTSLSSVKLPTTATTFGKYTFSNTGFETLDLSAFKDISEWGSYTFSECVGLTELNIPDSVKLGEYMFADCTSLQKVTFEDDYEGDLPSNMFRGCTSLREVHLPKDFGKKLPNSMFANCSALTDINLNETKISEFGNNIFQNCTSLREADLTTCTATALGYHMFDGCEALESVKLPDTIDYVSSYTFQNCTSLREIDLSNTKIDRFTSNTKKDQDVSYSTASYIFNGCTNLETVKLPAGGVTQIGAYAFQNCLKLTQIENLDIGAVTAIGKYAFAYCRSLFQNQTVALSSAITVLGEYAFLGCDSVEAYSANAAKVAMTSLADTGCVSLSSQNGFLIATPYNGGEEAVSTVIAAPLRSKIADDTLTLSGENVIGPYLFQNFSVDGVTKLDLSAVNTETIPVHLLDGSSFEEIILPDTVTSIGDNAFQNCTKLTKITLPAGLTAIGKYAFAGCVNLKTVEFGQNSVLTSIGDNAFQNCTNLTAIVLPENVSGLGAHVFDGCTALASVQLPESLTAIGEYAFMGSNLAQGFTIPENVASIGNFAFAQSNITAVTFEGNPQTIGNNLFKGCASLAKVNFGPCTTIGESEFDSSGLQTITIPETVLSVNQQAFMNCTALTSVTFEGTYETLGDYLFQGCSALQTVKLPEGLTKIANYMFTDCTSLGTLAIPETVEELGSSCFMGCTALNGIELPADLTTVRGSVFKGCTGLTGDLVLPDSVTSILASAFEDCSNLASIELSADVGRIQNSTFAGWTENQEIRFRNSAYEVAASCTVDWLRDLAPKVVYNYTAEK